MHCNAGARCDRKRAIKNLVADLADLAEMADLAGLAEMADLADLSSFRKGILHTYLIHTPYIPHTYVMHSLWKGVLHSIQCVIILLAVPG